VEYASREDQIAWAKLSKEAKRRTLDIFDKEKESNSNPVVVVNNHEIVLINDNYPLKFDRKQGTKYSEQYLKKKLSYTIVSPKV